MKKRTFTTVEKVALAVIATLIVAAICVGVVLIVGNTNKANEEIRNSEHTTVETITEAQVETETNADSTEKMAEGNTENKTTSKTTSSKTTSSNQNNSDSTKPDKTTSKTTSSSNTTSNNKQPNNKQPIKPEIIEPDTNKNHNSEKVCTVNGTKCYVGDTITVTVNLKTPVILENYQGYTEFDSSYLDYVNIEMNSGGVYNEKDSVIYYNASILSGIDFTSEGTIFTATFKVKKEGSTEIKNTIQILTDVNDKAVDFNQCKEEVNIYS